jgi:FHS family Na+ dependent glucose MFS transporter 1
LKSPANPTHYPIVRKRTGTYALLVGSYFLSYVLLGMTSATLGPALPHLARNVGTSLRGISSLFLAHRLGYMLGSFAGGRMYDRVAGNRLMAGVFLGVAAFLALIPTVAVLWLLVVVLFLLGTAEGGVDVGGNVLLVWTRPPRLGSLMNALHLFFGLGALLSPIILAQVIGRTGGIRLGYWLIAALVAPAAAILFPQASPKAAVPAPAETAPAGRVLLPLLIVVFFLLHVAVESSYGAWIYTYALTRKLANEVTAGYLTSAFWGAFTFGRLATIFLALKVSARIQLTGSLLGACLSLLLLLSAPGSAGVLWLATVACGMSLAGLFPGTITLASEHLHLSGGMTGYFLVGSSLGAMALPWLIGQFFESVGPVVFPAFLMVTAAAAMVLLGIILALLRRRVGSASRSTAAARD